MNSKPTALLMAGLCLCAASAKPATTTSKGPYHIIAERNCFHLTPVRPPQPAPAQPALPLPKIVLTGITTILGNKEALLKVQFPATPGQPAKQQSYILAEGQRDGVIQVVEVVTARPATPVRPRPAWARLRTQGLVRH